MNASDQIVIGTHAQRYSQECERRPYPASPESFIHQRLLDADYRRLGAEGVQLLYIRLVRLYLRRCDGGLRHVDRYERTLLFAGTNLHISIRALKIAIKDEVMNICKKFYKKEGPMRIKTHSCIHVTQDGKTCTRCGRDI